MIFLEERNLIDSINLLSWNAYDKPGYQHHTQLSALVCSRQVPAYQGHGVEIYILPRSALDM